MADTKSVCGALAVVAVMGLAACSNATTPLSNREKSVRSTDTKVAMKDCGSNCTGEIDGAKYSIRLPQQWNGTLLLYSHGYRFASPPPTDPNEAVDTDAQVSSSDADGTGSDPLSKKLLDAGYALAGSSYKSNGWAVADGVDAGTALHDKFVSLVGTPKRTYVWGDSLGGLITVLIAQKHPEWVDGAAPMCGAVAGPNLNFDAALVVASAVKALIDPKLKLTGYASAEEANAEWTRTAAAVKKAAADTAGGGTAKIVFIAALVDAPNKTKTFDGHDLVSQVKGMTESILTALAFGTAGRYEVEQRVGGNPSGTAQAAYDSRIDTAERKLVETVGGKPDALLKTLDSAPPITEDSAARQKFAALGDPSGGLKMPTVALHTTADPLVLVANETVLRQRTSGTDAQNLVQLYIAPPATYDEKDGAPYGAGHCNFTDDQRAALIAALDAWVRQSVYPGPVGEKQRFGDGLDPAYSPAGWPGPSN